ncbi:GTPase ObgE, partial [Neisseria meningitidis]
MYIRDSPSHGQRVCLAKGEKGGWANPHYKPPATRPQKQPPPGKEGKPPPRQLELKSLADVGLWGMPNAGKPPLFTAVSAA